LLASGAEERIVIEGLRDGVSRERERDAGKDGEERLHNEMNTVGV
jgi:hypothetical protein